MPFLPYSQGIIHASYWFFLLFCHKYYYCTTVISIVQASFMLHISTWCVETWECCCTSSTRCWIWKTKMMSSISMPLLYSTAPLQPDLEYRKRKKWYHLFLCLYLYFSAVLLIKKICSCCIILIPQFRSWWFYYILNDHKNQHLLKSWKCSTLLLNNFFFMYDAYGWVKYICICKFSELSSFLPKNKVHG